MDIGSLYRQGLVKSHGRSSDDEHSAHDKEEKHDELAAVPRSIVVSRSPVSDESSMPTKDEVDLPPEGTMVDVGDIVDVAFKELDTARRKADMTLATARSQASRVYREARRDARKLLSKARQKAQRLEDIGKSRGETARRAGFDKGFEEGKKEGMEEMRRQYGAALDVLCAMTEDLAQTKGELAQASDERLGRMMISLLRRVVGKLDTNMDQLLTQNLIAAVSENFHEGEEVFVRCNPQDLELIDSHLRETGAQPQALQQVFYGRMVQLKVDSSLARGRCRLWSTNKGLAFSFEERMDALEKELLRALTEEPDESR